MPLGHPDEHAVDHGELADAAGHRAGAVGRARGRYPDLGQLQAVGDFARERGLTELEVAFSWLASRPAVSSVIAGATRPEQVAQNSAAADWVPSVEDEAALDEIFPPAEKVALF